MGMTIVSGALSRDHVHFFVDIPLHVSVSEIVQRAKRRSCRRIQKQFELIRTRYWGQRLLARGYFSITSGNITDEVIITNLDRHTDPENQASAYHGEPTGLSR